MNKTQRVQRADGETTYHRILEAAGEQIATAGFADATNKAIATHAGVDLASINYHFNSRGGLYEAVLIEAHGRLIRFEDLQQIVERDLPARDKLKELIGEVVEGAIDKNSWHARVLAREILSPSSYFQVLQQKEILPKVQLILGILSEITSIPVDDPALIRCAVSVVAPCAMLVVFSRSPFTLANELFQMPREIMVAHLYQFAIGGLEKVGQEYSSLHHR